jgi:hypothetical protein
MELSLRVQQFMELVKAGDKLAAVEHARTHLAPWAGQALQVMASWWTWQLLSFL